MPQKKYTTFKLVRDYGAAILIAVVVAMTIRNYLLESFRVPTPVMSPNLKAGDLIFVSKWNFWKPSTEALHYGQIVVFSPTEDPGRNYIKRIIGMPGDKVEVLEGRLILNDELLPFSHGESRTCGTEKHPKYSYDICLEPPLMDQFGPRIVPEDSVFLIGDKRSKNVSRVPFAMAPIRSIHASVLFVWLSVVPESSGWIPRFRFHRMFQDIR